MQCIADTHYEVIRQRRYPYAIKHLACKFCIFTVSKRRTPMPRGTSSGLGRYNRMRAKMVAHLHECHRDKLTVPAVKRAADWDKLSIGHCKQCDQGHALVDGLCYNCRPA